MNWIKRVYIYIYKTITLKIKYFSYIFVSEHTLSLKGITMTRYQFQNNFSL